MKFFLRLLVLFVFLLAGIVFVKGYWKQGADSIRKVTNRGGLANTEVNYGSEVDRIANEFGLPAHYLKALIVLECSGRKKVPSRYEKHVFHRLKKVREGKKSAYEGITKEDIKDASDEALKNLASSWGPFQLMGYQCLKLGINVSDVRGPDAVYWGVKWIDEEYGYKLRQGKFDHAFRMHNTGSPTGRTHDPNYTKNGARYMEYFKKGI